MQISITKHNIPEIMPRNSPDLSKIHLIKIVTSLNLPRPLKYYATVCGRIGLKVTDKTSECNCEDCLRIVEDMLGEK